MPDSTHKETKDAPIIKSDEQAAEAPTKEKKAKEKDSKKKDEKKEKDAKKKKKAEDSDEANAEEEAVAADDEQAQEHTASESGNLVAPWDVCRADQAPLTGAWLRHYSRPITGHMTGLPPEPLNQPISTNSGVLSLLSLMLVLLAFNLRHSIILFKTLGQELFSFRRRTNIFDQQTTNEARTIFVMLMILWMCEGIMLYSGLSVKGIIHPIDFWPPVAAMVVVAIGFYIFQLIAYNIVGYTFTDSVGKAQWIKGFNTSQAFLGVALLIPTFITIFYPAVAWSMLTISLIFYGLARIAFIFKGFRIFYQNFQSSLYFILYLCALEVVPVVLTLTIASVWARLLS